MLILRSRLGSFGGLVAIFILASRWLLTITPVITASGSFHLPSPASAKPAGVYRAGHALRRQLSI
jgi:hypothetical protein